MEPSRLSNPRLNEFCRASQTTSASMVLHKIAVYDQGWPNCKNVIASKKSQMTWMKLLSGFLRRQREFMEAFWGVRFTIFFIAPTSRLPTPSCSLLLFPLLQQFVFAFSANFYKWKVKPYRNFVHVWWAEKVPSINNVMLDFICIVLWTWRTDVALLSYLLHWLPMYYTSVFFKVY